MKTETKVAHTPGPWNSQGTAGHDKHGQSVVYAETTGKDIAIVYDGDADAELIAAAPEMLDLLCRLCEWSWGQHYTIREADIWRDVDALKAQIDGAA